MENTGQIIRSKKTGKSRYTPISNDILQSLTLTAEEKSILVHLLSLPEDWMVYKINFGKSLNMGRHRFNNAWKGLVDKGYIVSVRMIDTTTNLMRGWNHMVYEEPAFDENRIDQNTDLPKIGQSEERVIYKVITEQSNNLTKEMSLVDTKKEKSNVPPPPVEILQDYKSTFELWFQYKKEKKQTYQPTGMKQLIKTMQEKYNVDQFKRCVEYSIAQNYSGIHEPKDLNKNQTPVATKQPKIYNIEDYD